MNLKYWIIVADLCLISSFSDQGRWRISVFFYKKTQKITQKTESENKEINRNEQH